MTARIVLIGTSGAGLGEQLARAIRATHLAATESTGLEGVTAGLAASTDGFVLDGFPRSTGQAEQLDAFLDARAASVEVALWLRTDAAPTPLDEALLRHYRGRVVEVAAEGALDELLERALDGIREATPALVG